jgi:hypothetical protein
MPRTPLRIVELSEQRFNALAAHSRSPAMAFIGEEIAWIADAEERLLGVVMRDFSDGDYAGIVLGRDEGRRFRCVDLAHSKKTVEEARAWLEAAIRWQLRDDQTAFPQGDDPGGVDLFRVVVDPQRCHPDFIKLTSDVALLPARSLINEIAPHFTDIDGNFIEQFQTTGFDARLWELYLFSYLHEEGLFIDRDHDRPDFIVTRGGETVAIEATIVGRRVDNPARFIKPSIRGPSPGEIAEKHAGEMPIRFGSPLFSKLKKRYWDLPHVAEKPLVFAIADFHDDQSMLWSSTALINYLYGVRHEFSRDEQGKLIISPLQIATHRHGDKEIPSGFFFQPDADYVSAVMFSATGTLSKFNRLGRQAGFVPPGVLMYRVGTRHDHDPNAHLPKMFSYPVTEDATEDWAEGLSMFHNPRARYPVPMDLFPSIAHHRFVDGQIQSALPDFHPYASMTFNMHLKPG